MALMMVTIRRDNDPFKKYWWVILAGFAAVGAWLCLPLMDASTGGGSVRGGEASLGASSQSLDAAANPSGAPGGTVDLSMDGAGHYKKNTDGAMTSSLYQAPETAAASASTNTLAMAKADTSLAGAMKAIARKTAADPSGWGGEKAQKGFAAPHTSFGAMGGLPGGSGSGASAAGATAGGPGFFGAANANVGVAKTQGLKGSVDLDKAPNAGMKALNNAASKSFLAAKSGSLDASAALSGQAFDGSGGGAAVGGAAVGGGGQVYGALDTAPANLKVDDPFADKKIDASVPHAPVPQPDKNAQMRQMVMMLVATVVVGGIMGAVGGSTMANVGMMAVGLMMQQNSQDTTNIERGAYGH